MEVRYKEISPTCGGPFAGGRVLRNLPGHARKLSTIHDVRLATCGWDSPRRPIGGEAQRVKLATELAKRGTGRTLYILDEPTTGLHFHDIKKLLEVLSRLADQGNTVLVIEHNLDVIKTADWVIDLGPEGGERGGYLVAEGTPEDIAACPESHTGRFLRPLLGMPARDPGDGRSPAASARGGKKRRKVSATSPKG